MADTVLNVATLVAVAIIGFLLIRYLPWYLSEKGKNLATKEDIGAITAEIEKTRLEYASELESFKASLARNLELLKISQAELQIHKTKEFIRFIDYFNDFFADKKKQQRLAANQNAKQEFNKHMLDLGVKLFFFASDATVKKYVEWRQYNLQSGPDGPDPMRLLTMYGELIVEIRKDLGHEDTKCDHNDFLNIMLKDWWKFSRQEVLKERGVIP